MVGRGHKEECGPSLVPFDLNLVGFEEGLLRDGSRWSFGRGDERGEGVDADGSGSALLLTAEDSNAGLVAWTDLEAGDALEPQPADDTLVGNVTRLVDLKLGRDLPDAVLLVGGKLEEASFLRLALESGDRLSCLGVPNLEVASIRAILELSRTLPCTEEPTLGRESEIDDPGDWEIAFYRRGGSSAGVDETSQVVHSSGESASIRTVLEDASSALHLIKAIDRGVCGGTGVEADGLLGTVGPLSGSLTGGDWDG